MGAVVAPDQNYNSADELRVKLFKYLWRFFLQVLACVSSKTAVDHITFGLEEVTEHTGPLAIGAEAILHVRSAK